MVTCRFQIRFAKSNRSELKTQFSYIFPTLDRRQFFRSWLPFRLNQSLPKELATGFSVLLERAFTLDRNSSQVAGFLQKPKKCGIVIVFRQIVRPNAAMRIGEMKVHYFASPNLDDLRVFVLLAQVEVVDDHSDVGVLHPAHHL